MIEKFKITGFWLDRLSKLLPPNSEELLQKILNKGMVAGGAVVYTLCPDLKPSQVGDIDIFVMNSKCILVELLELTEEWIKTNNISYTFLPAGFSKPPEFKDEVSLVTLRLEKKFSLQFIFSSFDKPMEVLNGFDLDYVQCGFYKGKVYQTEACKKALLKREIFTAKNEYIKGKRILKAIKKGFKVFPVFSDPNFNSFLHNYPLVLEIEEIFPLLTPTSLNDYGNEPGKDVNYPTVLKLSWEYPARRVETFKFLEDENLGSYFGIKINICKVTQKTINKREEFVGLIDPKDPWFGIFPDVFWENIFNKLITGLQFMIVRFARYDKPGPPRYYCWACNSFQYGIDVPEDVGFLPSKSLKDQFLSP